MTWLLIRLSLQSSVFEKIWVRAITKKLGVTARCLRAFQLRWYHWGGSPEVSEPLESSIKGYVYLFPCSFLYEPPYLLLVPRMSIISGMKLANIAWWTSTWYYDYHVTRCWNPRDTNLAYWLVYSSHVTCCLNARDTNLAYWLVSSSPHSYFLYSRLIDPSCRPLRLARRPSFLNTSLRLFLNRKLWTPKNVKMSYILCRNYSLISCKLSRKPVQIITLIVI